MRTEFSKVRKQIHMALKSQKGAVSLEEAKTQIRAHLKSKALARTSFKFLPSFF